MLLRPWNINSCKNGIVSGNKIKIRIRVIISISSKGDRFKKGNNPGTGINKVFKRGSRIDPKRSEVTIV